MIRISFNKSLQVFKKKKLEINISDEFVKMKEIKDKKKLIKQSNIIILGVPHTH